MAKTPRKSPQRARPQAAKPPYIGALLRLAYQAARKRQLDAQAHRGFTDLNQTLLSVLVFPPPDGVGPTELANRTHMTKQAMNYLLGQLERLGYVERRSANGGRSLVYLTRKGWDVFETQWAAMRQLEKEWAELIGGKRFATFMQVLRELAATNSAYVGNQASGGAKTERGR